MEETVVRKFLKGAEWEKHLLNHEATYNQEKKEKQVYCMDDGAHWVLSN